MVPTGGTSSPTFSSEGPPLPLLPGSWDSGSSQEQSSALAHAAPSVQSVTNALAISLTQNQAGAPLFSGMAATERGLFT